MNRSASFVDETVAGVVDSITSFFGTWVRSGLCIVAIISDRNEVYVFITPEDCFGCITEAIQIGITVMNCGADGARFVQPSITIIVDSIADLIGCRMDIDIGIVAVLIVLNFMTLTTSNLWLNHCRSSVWPSRWAALKAWWPIQPP